MGWEQIRKVAVEKELALDERGWSRSGARGHDILRNF
jgi:hypothetical protein